LIYKSLHNKFLFAFFAPKITSNSRFTGIIM